MDLLSRRLPRKSSHAYISGGRVTRVIGLSNTFLGPLIHHFSQEPVLLLELKKYSKNLLAFSDGNILHFFPESPHIFFPLSHLLFIFALQPVCGWLKFPRFVLIITLVTFYRDGGTGLHLPDGYINRQYWDIPWGGGGGD